MHARDVHFVGVCSLNCTRASTHAYYARVQSSVHEKNTHALTVCTNCTCVFRHVYDSQDLPYAVHSSRFRVSLLSLPYTSSSHHSYYIMENYSILIYGELQNYTSGHVYSNTLSRHSVMLHIYPALLHCCVAVNIMAHPRLAPSSSSLDSSSPFLRNEFPVSVVLIYGKGT